MNNSKFQYWFFIIFTIVYFLILNKYFGVTLEKVKALGANELGDFLAGTFSPLAFLFLILGYLQNNKNLGQNTEAISQQAIALQQQSESLKQQALALDTQIAELKLSNTAYQRQVDEMEKSVEAQQKMFQLAEIQYNETNEEKLKGSMPLINYIGSKYTLTQNHGGSSQYHHQFRLTLKINNKSIKNLKIRSNFWYITKIGGSYDQSLQIEINSIDLNKSDSFIFYIKSDTVPFNNNILNFDYYDESNTKYSKIFKITKNADDYILLEEISTGG